MIQKKKILRRRLQMLTKRYLTVLGEKTNYNRTSCNPKITEIENTILRVTGLVTAASLNAKATEIRNKILDTSGVIVTLGFSRLTKISYHIKIKIKNQMFDLSHFVILMMNHRIS